MEARTVFGCDDSLCCFCVFWKKKKKKFNHNAAHICLFWWLIRLLHQKHEVRYCKFACLCTISSNHLFKTLDISWSFSPGFSPGWKKRGWHIMTGDPIRSQARLTRWTPLLTGWQIGEKGRAWSTYKCTPALPLKTLWKRVPGAQLLSNSWFIRNVWTGLNLRVRAEVFLHYRWRSDFSFYLNYLEYNRHVSAAT